MYASLGDHAGRDPIQDREFVGRLKATKAILNMAYEDIYGETEDGN